MISPAEMSEIMVAAEMEAMNADPDVSVTVEASRRTEMRLFAAITPYMKIVLKDPLNSDLPGLKHLRFIHDEKEFHISYHPLARIATATIRDLNPILRHCG